MVSTAKLAVSKHIKGSLKPIEEKEGKTNDETSCQDHHEEGRAVEKQSMVVGIWPVKRVRAEKVKGQNKVRLVKEMKIDKKVD